MGKRFSRRSDNKYDMTYEEKKYLYEQIMKEISETVGKFLNESQIDLLSNTER